MMYSSEFDTDVECVSHNNSVADALSAFATEVLYEICV